MSVTKLKLSDEKQNCRLACVLNSSIFDNNKKFPRSYGILGGGVRRGILEKNQCLWNLDRKFTGSDTKASYVQISVILIFWEFHTAIQSEHKVRFFRWFQTFITQKLCKVQACGILVFFFIPCTSTQESFVFFLLFCFLFAPSSCSPFCCPENV